MKSLESCNKDYSISKTNYSRLQWADPLFRLFMSHHMLVLRNHTGQESFMMQPLLGCRVPTINKDSRSAPPCPASWVVEGECTLSVRIVRGVNHALAPQSDSSWATVHPTGCTDQHPSFKRELLSVSSFLSKKRISLTISLDFVYNWINLCCLIMLSAGAGVSGWCVQSAPWAVSGLKLGLSVSSDQWEGVDTWDHNP